MCILITQNNDQFIINSEDNSDANKTTIGGLRIEITNEEERMILHLTRKEATELAKLIRLNK
jgi:hypothetical protein